MAVGDRILGNCTVLFEVVVRHDGSTSRIIFQLQYVEGIVSELLPSFHILLQISIIIFFSTVHAHWPEFVIVKYRCLSLKIVHKVIHTSMETSLWPTTNYIRKLLYKACRSKVFNIIENIVTVLYR